MKALVTVTLKTGVLDPQGAAIANALRTLGFDTVRGARQGKIIELDLTEDNPVKAERDVERMAETLLANGVIEDFTIEILD
ncbi:MAG: phosphoribosylformylglycinamidine synthase subunit PurS [Pseudomonadota bacterium]